MHGKTHNHTRTQLTFTLKKKKKKNSIAFYFTVNSLLDFVITNFWNSFFLSCSLQLDLVSNYFQHWFDRQDDYHRRLRCRIEPLNIWVLSFISLQNFFFRRRIERINKNSEEKLKNLLMGFLTRCISYEHSIADVCGSGVCVFDSTNFTPFTRLGIHMKRKIKEGERTRWKTSNIKISKLFIKSYTFENLSTNLPFVLFQRILWICWHRCWCLFTLYSNFSLLHSSNC